MNYYPFNSRNKLYRSQLGAVAAGKNLQLRLLLHRDACVRDAFIVITNDSDNTTQNIKMNRGEWLDNYQFFCCDLSLQEGLYWYDFKYTSDHGDFFVVKSEKGLGTVARERGERFQLTVFSADFKTPDWLKGGVIYQIFPDRFFASGAHKQNIPDDRFICDDWSNTPEHRITDGKISLGNDYYGGDLLGIEQKLDYLKDLGVNCIYLNPIFEAHSNHRYNTANYEKIDCLLGDENDFKRLCKKAKDKGIHIILDGVFSHTGDDSIYFNRKRRYGEGGAYNDRSSPYFSWFKFSDFPNEYKSWWGIKTLPETDENNPAFTEYITGENGVLRKYLRLGADGWRLDVADELPDEFLDCVRTAVKAENADAYILGEVWEDATNKISYGSRRRFLRGTQLDSVMNYPFANAILNFMKYGGGEALCETVYTLLENYPEEAVHTLMNHIGTHDTKRILTVLGRDNDYVGNRDWQSTQRLSKTEYERGVARLKAAAVIQYTLPGVPSVFYGDEAGVEGFSDPFCRATYPWGKENTDLVNFYKELGKVRRCCKAFKDGDFYCVNVSVDSIAFTRKSAQNHAFIAVNRGNESTLINIPEEFIGCKSFGSVRHGSTTVLNKNEFIILYK